MKECLSCSEKCGDDEQVCLACRRKTFRKLTAAEAVEAAMEKAIKLEKRRKFDEAKYWLNEAANHEKEVLRDKERPKWGIVARSEPILPSFLDCPKCKKRFPREQTIDTSYSYDDGWCYTYEFRCPKCNSELYRMSTNA